MKKIRQIGIAITLLFLSTQLIAQSTIEDFLGEGVQYHDNGNYEKAIETYKKALKIDPTSTLVNYEIALSYFSKKDYKKAIKHSDIVLNQNAEYMLQVYLTKGSALDMLGKTKESIKLFEIAIKKLEGHYLLYYNLALNHYKLNDVSNAEKNVIKAIEKNSNHPSSHLLLAKIHDKKGNTVQTLLAIHYFLFLEPNTKRSIKAFEILKENFGGNVSRNDSEPNKTTILFLPNNDDQFSAAALMVSMLEASNMLEDNKEKAEDEMFIENTESFFKVLGELKKEKNKEIWWTFYTTFFYDLAKSDHLETYCKYITQSDNENSKKWLKENEVKLADFSNWLKDN